jgi:hypothetical protein
MPSLTRCEKVRFAYYRAPRRFHSEFFPVCFGLQDYPFSRRKAQGCSGLRVRTNPDLLSEASQKKIEVKRGLFGTIWLRG